VPGSAQSKPGTGEPNSCGTDEHPGTLVATHEQGKKGKYAATACFADYKTESDSVAGRTNLVTNKKFAKLGYKEGSTTEGAVDALVQGALRTDKDYKSKLLSINKGGRHTPESATEADPHKQATKRRYNLLFHRRRIQVRQTSCPKQSS